MAHRERRHGETECTIFGRHPVLAALSSQGAEVLSVAVARGEAADFRKVLRKRCSDAEIEFAEVARDELTRRTGAARHDQGVAARVRFLRVIEIDAFIASRTGAAAREPARLLALDGVTNSQNVGMVVRSVVGAGLEGMLWPTTGQPWINGLVVRAAVGAIFECPIVRCDTVGSGLAALQGAGFESYGLDAGADASLFATAPKHRSVFVLGSESAGLSPDVADQLDQLVSIPMSTQLESLNVAVAAGLVAFHAAGRLANL